MYGINFISTTAKGNLPVTYVGADDSTTTAQSALLLAGKAGTDGVVDGVIARYVDYGVVKYIDAAGNAILRRMSDLTGNKADYDVVDSTHGLLGHMGAPGGTSNALAVANLGAPALADNDIVHAAIDNPSANSTTGIHAAITLTSAAQSIETGITDPSGRLPSITGNASGNAGVVTIIGTDLNGDAAQCDLLLNGSSTVIATLQQLPYGMDTVTKIIVPPQTHAGTDTVAIGYGPLVVIDGFTDPDVPQLITGLGAEADQAQVIQLYGTDYDNQPIFGSITLNGTTAANSDFAFRSVISAAIPAQNDAGETTKLGTSNALGLPYKMDHDAVLAAQFGTVHEATRPTVTYDGTYLAGNTVLLNSSLDGSKQVIVDFIRCDAPALGFVTGSV